jgi:hypothetical protein
VSVYEKIAALGIVLSEVTPPVAAYVLFVRSGHQLFLSGHIAKESGKPWVGPFGLTPGRPRSEQNQANRQTDGAGQQRADIHRAASRGQRGVGTARGDFWANSIHARSAFGVAQVPFGSCVEID